MQVSGQLHTPHALPSAKVSSTHCTASWVGPRAGLVVLKKIKNVYLCRESNSICSDLQLAAKSLYWRSYSGAFDKEYCFLSPTHPDRLCSPPSLLIGGYYRLFCRGIKRPGREANLVLKINNLQYLVYLRTTAKISAFYNNLGDLNLSCKYTILIGKGEIKR